MANPDDHSQPAMYMGKYVLFASRSTFPLQSTYAFAN